MNLGDRPLPHNVEAEQSALGSVFIRPSIWPQMAAQLPMDAFFLPAHREIYDAMTMVASRSMPLDPITVADELKARGALSRLDGGEQYLMRLMDPVPNTEHADAYVQIVRKQANKRTVIRLCIETVSRAMGDADDDVLVEALGRGVSSMVLRGAGELTRLGEFVEPAFAEIEARKDGAATGVETGVVALDAMTCGFQPGELVIVGADPGAGKSALAVQAGLQLCMADGGTCFCANLEMSKQQLTERALAHLAEVNSFSLRRGKVSVDDWRELYRVGGILQKLDFYVEDSVTTVREFGVRARMWRARHPKRKGLAVFDFLQLAQGGTGTNRAQQVGNDARELKALAKELEVAIIGVSSLNRDKKDNDKPPTKKSLKESGDVEFAGDFVILIWNKDETKDGPVTLICDKGRNGVPGGWIAAHWIGRHYRFRDVGHEPQQQQIPLSA